MNNLNMKRFLFLIIFDVTCLFGQERENTVKKLTIVKENEIIVNNSWKQYRNYGETEWCLIDDYISLQLYLCKEDDNFKMLSIIKKEYDEGDIYIWIGSDAKVHSYIKPSGYVGKISTTILSKNDIERLINVTLETEYPFSVYGRFSEPNEQTFKTLRYNYERSTDFNYCFTIKRYKNLIRFYFFKDESGSLKDTYYEISYDDWVQFLDKANEYEHKSDI